jgi:hypothetical protein
MSETRPQGRQEALLRLTAIGCATVFVFSCTRDQPLGLRDDLVVSEPHASYGGDTVEGAYARFYRADSLKIEVKGTTSNCNITNSHLWAVWNPGGVDWLSTNACASTGQSWMKRPSINVDSGGVFMTTSYDSAFVFGTANLRIGDYPKYTFLLKRGMNGGNYGDIEVCITVFPCHRTSDPAMNDTTVRRQLLEFMALSNPDSTSASMKRREIAGGVFMRVEADSDTVYYLKETPTYLVQTACRTSFGSVQGDSAGDMPVGIFHTHPNMPGDTVYGCAGANSKQTPTGPGVVRFAGDPRRTGGGSAADWRAADSSGFAQYVMSANGVIARLDPGVTLLNQPTNQNLWYWRNNPTGCRAWSAPR